MSRTLTESVAVTESARSKTPLVVFLILLVVLLTTVVLRQPALAPEAKNARARQASISGHTLYLELAETPQEQAKGLSNRKSLSPQTGMLFVFSNPGRPCFWMKDTLIPLDMLWLDADYKLVYQRQNVQPSSYPESFCPDQDAKYVLELGANESARLGLEIGNTLTLQ